MQVLAWLLVGYSDGVISNLMEETQINGYLVFLIPVVALYLAGLFVTHRLRVSERLIKRQLLIAALFVFTGLVQAIIIGSFHIYGFVQLFAMVALILLFTDLFAENGDLLRPGFAKAMAWVNWIICSYIVLAWFAMRLWEVDISLFISDVAELGESAASRTSGLHREPAWVAYAVATSYLAVHFTREKGLLPFQIAFLAAVTAAAAGSGLVIAAVFIGHQLVTTRNVSPTVKAGLIAGFALMSVIVFGGRIAEVLDNSDPSTRMRTESAIVALEVIEQTFPIGTGYGNYRDIADFDEDLWRGFIDLQEAEFYKSDILILNLVAELGIVGCLLVVLLFRNFRVRGSFLILAVAAVMMLTAGTLVMPFYLVLAATAGLEISRRRAPRARVPAFAVP